MTFGLQIEPHTGWMNTSSGNEVLHHEIRKWFYWLTSTVRPQLQGLLDARGPTVSDMDNALYFHVSVGRHLRDRAARTYQFPKPEVNRQLGQVDQRALRLFVRSRLLGLEPRH